MKLKNKVAFITGGTSGIGLETAKLFQAEGANVVLVGANEERLAAPAAKSPTSNARSKRPRRNSAASMSCSLTQAQPPSLRWTW